MTPWEMACTHLSRKRALSVILLLSLAFSVGAAGLLLRIYALTQSRFDSLARGGDAIIGAKAGGIEILLGSLNLEAENPRPLPFNLFRSLRSGQTVQFEDGAQVPTSSFVEAVIPLLFFGHADNFKVIGTDLTFFNRPQSADSLVIDSGRYFSDGGLGQLDEIVVGRDVAARKHLKTGDTLHVRMDDPQGHALSDSKDFTVVGVLKSSSSAWDRGIYGSYQGAFAWFTERGKTHPIWKEGIFNYFLLYMKKGSGPVQFQESFGAMQSLVNDRTVGQIISVEQERKNLSQLTGSGGELGLFIISFIILLSALSVTGMMMMRYEGMRLQTAVMRAMGFSAQYLLMWLMYEGFILAGISCVIGALFDLILFYPVVSLLGHALPDTDIYSVSLLMSSPVWIAATLATLFGILLPFRRLYKMDVHSVLKGL